MNKLLVSILGALFVATGSLFLRPMALAAAADGERGLPAASEAVTIHKIQVGFDGNYKLGYWTPVRVTLRADGDVQGHLEVTVPDGDGVPTTVAHRVERPITLASGDERTEMVYVKPGQVDGPFTVQFVGDARPLAERVFYPAAGGGANEVTRGMPATVRLLVVVGGDLQLAEALRLGEDNAAIATHVAIVHSADELPDQAIGWDGVDGVVLNTSDPAPFLKEPSAERLGVLAKWLQLGGRVFVFVGRSGEELLQAGGPLADFVPGTYVRQEVLRQARDVEGLCDGQFRLAVPPGFSLPVPYVSPVDGRVVSAGQGGNLPLVVRTNRGFGELTWVGLDLDLPPLSDWIGKPEFLRRVIGVAREAQNDVASDAGQLTSLGYTDLVGQLRAALDVFPGVRTYPFAWVIGFTLLYLALLGPLDYLLVHRWGRRPVFTWLTLPVFVIVVAGGAYGLAKGTKGQVVRLNQVEVVDVDTSSGLVRGTVWADLYTPRHDRLNLALKPQLPAGLAVKADTTETVLSWLALPGKGLGGVGAAADASSIQRGYRYEAERSRLEGLPLPIWSSKSLHAFWTAEATVAFDSALTTNADQELAGTVTNGLELELTNVRLYYRGRFCRLATMAPGQSIDLDSGTLWISAGNDLTGRTLSKDAPPYDAATRDARRVLQMMMWYNLAGGANYVSLLNRYHALLDFGHLQDAGRAVLVADVADAPPSGSRVLNDGRAIEDPDGLRMVVYRFVLPVEPAP